MSPVSIRPSAAARPSNSFEQQLHRMGIPTQRIRAHMTRLSPVFPRPLKRSTSCWRGLHTSGWPARGPGTNSHRGPRWAHGEGRSTERVADQLVLGAGADGGDDQRLGRGKAPEQVHDLLAGDTIYGFLELLD